jgi:hypothetical protein
VKLPKQWKDWCRKSGLRAVNSGFKMGRKYDYWCLKGKGRHWRVNCYGEFQCSERYAEFDRWANSHIELDRIPQSLKEFRDTVRILSARHTDLEIILDQLRRAKGVALVSSTNANPDQPTTLSLPTQWLGTDN